MAFALKGAGSNSSSLSTTANQSSYTLTTVTTAGASGDLAVIRYAVDNNQTTDGDESAVTSISDSAGNTWVKAVEFTNGQGTAQTGVTCGIWYSNLTAALAVGSTITLNFSNNTSRDASAVGLEYFTKASGFNAAIEGTPGTLANDGAAAGSLNVTTSNIACLRIRATASESSTTTAWTKTAAFTAVLTQAVTASGATAANVGIRGEYLISTSTGQASAPTGGAGAVDNASVYVAFREVAITNITVSATSAGAVSVRKTVNKTVAATSTRATSVLKGINKSFLATVATWTFQPNSPQFALDFVNGKYVGGTLASLISNTNSTGGYVTNSDGTLTLIAANTPRIGVGTGLLIEESRTNGAIESSTITTGTAWHLQQSTWTANAAVAPDGTTTAVLHTAANAPGTHSIYQNLNGTSQAVTSNVDQTFTVYAKMGTNRYAYLNYGSGGVPSSHVTKVYDLQAGALGETKLGSTSGTLTSASIEALANGWYRLTMVAKLTIGSTTDGFFEFGMANALTGNSFTSFGEVTFTGAGTETCYFWGPQHEKDKSFATSYYPTTTAVATRSADNVLALGALASMIASTTGSIVAKTTQTKNVTNNQAIVGDGGSRQFLAFTSSDTSIVQYNGSTTLSATIGDSRHLTTDEVNTGVSWSPSGRSIVGNGGDVATDTNTVGTPNGTPYIGAYSSSSGTQICGYINRLSFWSTRLADKYLQRYTCTPSTVGVPASTVDLDLSGGNYYGATLTSVLANSNASGGYVINADGTLTLIGANTLRRGVGTGLLIEESATNKLTRSQEFSHADWSKDAPVTITANTQTAPDGTVTADTFSITTTTTQIADVYQSKAISSGVNETLSLYVKAGTNDKVGLTLQSSASQNFVTKVFDLATGTLGETKLGTSSGTLSDAGIESLANGWYRIWMTANIAATAAYFVLQQANAATGNTFTTAGDITLPFPFAGKTVYIWQADYVTAAHPTSPVVTTTAAATRNADVVTVIGAASTALNHTTAATVAIEVNPPTYTPGDSAYPGLLSSGSGVFYSESNANVANNNYEGAGAGDIVRLGSIRGGFYASFMKAALAWTVSGGRSIAGNGRVATDSNEAWYPPNGNLPGTPIYLGSFGGSSAWLNGYISRFTVWGGVRLSDSVLTNVVTALPSFSTSIIGILTVAGAILVTISATLTGSTSFLRSVGKIVSATKAGTVTATKSATKTVSATGGSATSFIRSVGKFISATAASATTLTKSNTFARAITATAAGAVSFVKSVGKLVTATAAATTSAIKSAGKTVSATSAGAVSVIKSIGKLVAVASAGTAAVTKALPRTIAATATSATSAIKEVGKLVSATATGALTVLKAATRTINATSTGTTSVIKSIGKSILATATGTVLVSAIRVFLVAVLATCSGAVSFIKSIGKTVATTSTGTTTLVRLIGKSIAATSVGTASVLKSTGKLVTLAASGLASVATQFISGAGAVFNVTVSATAAGAVVVSKSVGKLVTLSSSGTVTVRRAVGKLVSATALGTTSLIKSIGATRSVTAAASVGVIKSAAKLVFATITGSTTTAATKVILVLVSATAAGAVSVRRAAGKVISAGSVGVVSVSNAIAVSLTIVTVASTEVVKSITKLVLSTVSGLTSAAVHVGAFVYQVAINVQAYTAVQWLVRLLRPRHRVASARTGRQVAVSRTGHNVASARAAHQVAVPRTGHNVADPQNSGWPAAPRE